MRGVSLISTFDNPAACFEAVLDAINKVSGDEQPVPTWMKILDVPDEHLLAAGIADLTSQFQAVKSAVEELPDTEDPDLFRQYLPAIERVLNDLLLVRNAGKMTHYKSLVTGEMVVAMRSCSGALRRNSSMVVPTLDDDAVQQLLELVRELVDEVISAGLSPTIQMFMVGKLREVEDLLLHVKIAGFTAVVDKLDEMLGGAIREARGDRTAFEKAHAFIQRLWAKLTTVATGTSAITGAVEDTMRLLGGGQ